MATIVDADGNPIDMGQLREPQTAHVAHLAREFDEHPARGLTPARLQGILAQAEQGDLIRQLELADDMEERDSHLYAELSKRKGAISALDWSIEAPDAATPDEQALADEVHEWVESIPDFEDLLLGMMDAVLKGFAMHELVWKLEGKVLLPSITFRPQRWFTLDQETRSRIELRGASNRSEPLKPFAWLAHQHKSRNGYLARQSLSRVLAWPFIFKNYAWRDRAEWLEIFGLPLRIGKYPTGASETEKRALMQAVMQIGHNAAGIMPQGMAIEFQAAATAGLDPFQGMLDYCDASESKAILGQTLTAGEGKHGTQALGNVHNEVRMDVRNADARQVESTISRQLIYPLCVLNKAGVDVRRLPKFCLDISEPEDLGAYADALPKLATVGLQIPVKWAQEKLGIPEPMEGEEVLSAPPPPPAPGAVPAGAPVGDKSGLPAKKAPPPAALKGGHPAPGGDLIDGLADEALGDWRPMLAPLVEPLFAELDRAIAAGESLESFRDRLPALVERMDGKPLAENVSRAAFVARLMGSADIDVSGNETE